PDVDVEVVLLGEGMQTHGVELLAGEFEALLAARLDHRLLDALVGDHGEARRLAGLGHLARLVPQAQQILVAGADLAAAPLLAAAADADLAGRPVELGALGLAPALVDLEQR